VSRVQSFTGIAVSQGINIALSGINADTLHCLTENEASIAKALHASFMKNQGGDDA